MIMAEDVAESQQTLVSGLTLLVNWGKILLSEAKKNAEVSLEDFVPHKISTLFGLITAGADFYKSLGVKKWSEAETIWQKFYDHEAVREQVEELLQLETEWDSFLEGVDRGLQTTDTQLSGGQIADTLSPETELIDARSAKSVTLGQYLGQGQKLLLVLIRHFG